MTMHRFLESNTLMFARINEIEAKQLAFYESTEEKFGKMFKYILEHEEVLQMERGLYYAFKFILNSRITEKRARKLADKKNARH